MGSSLYLVAEPGFLYGVARLLDFGNTFDFYNQCPTAREADSLGVLLDWEMVGQDLWTSVRNYGAETNSPHRNHSEEAQPVGR